MSFLQIQGLSKTYPNGINALRDVHLELAPGERLVLLGPSGAGKSTLLRILAGLEAPSAGRVLLDNIDITVRQAHERGIGVLTQHPALYPHLTAGENITLGRRPLSHPIVDLLGLGPLLSRYPNELSGGERQRVALARLVSLPHRLWLLDEPLTGLDPSLRAEFRQDLLLLNRQLHVTMMFVTHDFAEAWSWGQRVGVLGQGQLLEVGLTSQLACYPSHLLTWKSLQLGTTVDGLVVGGEQKEFVSSCGTIRLTLPDWLAQFDCSPNLTLGIRPEDVVLPDLRAVPSEDLLQLAWPIFQVEPVGRGWALTLAKGRTFVKVLATTHAPPPVDSPINWYLPIHSACWFDTNTGIRRAETSAPRLDSRN